MGDYDLSKLSPREFQHLVQALAMKEFGHRLVPYGDGPDGGRDATYEGRINASGSRQPWDGYLVVQVKHKQKPKDDSRDALWLSIELTKEFKAFSKTAGRRKPEYYIIATNVSLSSMPEVRTKQNKTQGKAFRKIDAEASKTGGLARIEGVFSKYRETLGLKDTGIWHYEKIRTLLDVHSDIARRYAAWITPGDVLSLLAEQVVPGNTVFAQAMSLYLQRELRADQYVKLEQAGHSPKEQTALASVFVDTPVIEPVEGDDERERQNFVSMLLTEADKCFSPSFVENTAQVSELSSDPERTGRFVLIGGPGQGKTTIGQFVAQLYRVGLLQEQQRHLLNSETKGILENIRAQCREEGIVFPNARRFPVRVSLPQFADSLALEARKSKKLSLLS